MNFNDRELESLTLKEVNDFIKLFQYLCGQEFSKINIQDKILLQRICTKAEPLNLDYEQFNTILLVLNQPTISEKFFQFFFELKDMQKIQDLEQLRRGTAKFRGYAMLCYGNFRFAYKELSRAKPKRFEEITQRFTIETGNKRRTSMEQRPDKLVEIENIPKDNTHLLGYLSSAKVRKDQITYAAIYSIRKVVSVEQAYSEIFPGEKDIGINKIREEIEGNSESLREAMDLDIVDVFERVKTTDKEIKTFQEIGQKNTDLYLTWDYMDVYVATSMREEWEYKDCWDFVEKVFSNEELRDLKLRYFNPTQSYVPNRIDKGLIEGLMLKRAKCTIYLAQETDTLGKDSELAATLAQGKPVIAFVPKITDDNEQTYIEKYKRCGLRFLSKRLMLLEAEEILEEPILQGLLEDKFGVNFLDEFYELRERVLQYLDLRLFYSWESMRQKEYRERNEAYFDKLQNMFLQIEKFYFDKRADTLIEKHPLAIQVNINTGVANGVLVVRDERDCAKLLYRIFTNNLDLEIVHKAEEAVTILKENISKSPYRVVTDYEKLTNSFWNFYLTELQERI